MSIQTFTNKLLFQFLLLVFFTPLFGQNCPPPGFPDPGNTCPEAPILCPNLDGYCSTINNNNVSQNFPCCPGWTLNNDEWFAFFAGTSTITIEVVPQNCTSGNQMGLQGGIYAECPLSQCNNAIVMDLQCACTEDPFILTSNNYVVGEIYWFVVDGCLGNVCDYTIHVLEGSTIGVPPDNPGPIAGVDTVCQNAATQYTIDPVVGATVYTWTLTPPDAGSLIANGTQANVMWADTFSGSAELCMVASNLCQSNDTPSCLTIEVQPTAIRSESISFCPGGSATINGQVYTQSGVVLDTLPSADPADCDTVVTYTITLLPLQTRADSISFCPGSSVNIDGQVYTQSGTVIDTIPASAGGGCDTIVTHTLTLLPFPTRTESISFCPGNSVTIGGQVYNQSGTVIDTIPASAGGGCDTIVTYTLTLLSFPTRTESISFCPGNSVTIGGQVYNQSGTVIDTIPASAGGGCDTIVTYSLTLLPYPTRSESIAFCPGNSVTIGGQVYNQSGIVVDTIPATVSGACDTIATYDLTLLPQPTRAETIAFCPGETITLGGVNYTQPGTVVLTIPSTTNGCDTIATYTLQYLTPAPSNVSINCPGPISVHVPSGSTGSMVMYNPATAASDCPCPGIALVRTSGPVSGANFPLGSTSVCYTAKDSCGQSAACCFNVSVVEDDDACDTKVNGCIKYELLTITEDMAKNRTYRIRVTNNCNNKLLYTAIQVPDGIVAISPLNFSTYTAPSGNTYTVRNPNYSPTYSVRYSSVSDSINLGESDIFKYTLPAQASVTFIHVVSRLAPYLYLEAHLNTFYCPIGVTPSGGGDRPSDGRDEQDLTTFQKLSNLNELLLFPNPATQLVQVEIGGQTGELMLQDATGRVVMRQMIKESQTTFSVENLPQGLYQAIFVGEKTILHSPLAVQH